MSDRIDLSVVDSRAGLVHGDTGRSYWATVDGWCECPDHAKGHTCKHALAVKIACQMRAVMKAKQAQQQAPDARTIYIKLCQDLQQYVKLLIAQGIRPVDDPAWRTRDETVQSVKAQLAPLSIR